MVLINIFKRSILEVLSAGRLLAIFILLSLVNISEGAVLNISSVLLNDAPKTYNTSSSGNANSLDAIIAIPDAAITSVTGTSPLCVGAAVNYNANGVVPDGGIEAWSSSDNSILLSIPPVLLLLLEQGIVT